MITVGLVACGAAKLAHRAPARELYVGNLFRAASSHAERTCDAWAILSAEHGLVLPDEVLDPYNRRVDALTVEQLRTWTFRVDGRLRLDLGLGRMSQAGESVTVAFFAGEAYRQPLLERWGSRWRPLSWRLECPLAGLGIGEQLAWYKRHR